VADFEVHEDGQVHALLIFASAEPLGGLALDRDGDGVVTVDEVSAARDELRVFFLQEVGVDADGSPCAATFRDASLTDVDGLLLRATYACPSDATDVEATLYYLSGASGSQPGARPNAARVIARIEAGSAMTEGVLTGQHRAIALHIVGHEGVRQRKTRRAGVLAVAAVLVGLLAYGLWRRRSARAAWRNPNAMKQAGSGKN